MLPDALGTGGLEGLEAGRTHQAELLPPKPYSPQNSQDEGIFQDKVGVFVDLPRPCTPSHFHHLIAPMPSDFPQSDTVPVTLGLVLP